MAENRVVIGKKGDSSMVPVRWTQECPDDLDDVETAEELGAKWEGDELVTYDVDGFRELFSYYESNDYQIDND